MKKNKVRGRDQDRKEKVIKRNAESKVKDEEETKTLTRDTLRQRKKNGKESRGSRRRWR